MKWEDRHNYPVPVYDAAGRVVAEVAKTTTRVVTGQELEAEPNPPDRRPRGQWRGVLVRPDVHVGAINKPAYEQVAKALEKVGRFTPDRIDHFRWTDEFKDDYTFVGWTGNLLSVEPVPAGSGRRCGGGPASTQGEGAPDDHHRLL